jgi:hypothetical protein
VHGSCFRTLRGQTTAIATLGGKKKGRRETEYLGLPPFACGLKLNAARTARGRRARFLRGVALAVRRRPVLGF